MSDIPLLGQSVLTANSLSNLLLATPTNEGYRAQLENNNLDESYLFHFEGESFMNLKSEITDHYNETNEALNDDIALKPISYTTTGYIGEVNDVVPEALQPVAQSLEKLTDIQGFIPELTIEARRQYNNALQLYSAQQKIRDAANSKWDNVVDQNEQQKAFGKFFGYWKSKTLFTLQTPWGIFKNMAIENLRPVQDASTQEMTTFELTFKEIRFSTDIFEGQNETLSGRSQSQALQGKGVDRGKVNPSVALVSFDDIYGGNNV